MKGRTRVSQHQSASEQPTKVDQDLGDEEVISLETTLVNISFSVTDSENRLVADVTQREVVLAEDDVKQQIVFYGRNRNLPMVLALVADFSGSQELIWPQARRAAQKFFRQVFRPGQDYVAVASFRNAVQLHIGLTSNQKRLDRAFTSFARVDTGYARQGTALYDALFTVVDEVLDGRTAQRILTENDSLIRRALIVLTDGRDTSSLRSAAAAIDRAHRALVTLYAIGIGDGFRFAGVDRETLDGLCRETGGRAYYPRNPHQLGWAFREIAEELTTQYIVGYHPTNTAEDGSFRKIQLELPGRKAVTVRYRKGYYAKTEDR